MVPTALLFSDPSTALAPAAGILLLDALAESTEMYNMNINTNTILIAPHII